MLDELSAKSDVPAKLAFVADLKSRGIDARVTGSPADVTAEIDGRVHYFEVKYTRAENTYFGAATLTEWQAALDHEERFRFVVAFMRDGKWVFHEYTPRDFMRFSSIPPFKIFFRVGVEGDPVVAVDTETRSVRLTHERIREMATLFGSWRARGN